jgi:hypothetical protein
MSIADDAKSPNAEWIRQNKHVLSMNSRNSTFKCNMHSDNPNQQLLGIA